MLQPCEFNNCWTRSNGKLLMRGETGRQCHAEPSRNGQNWKPHLLMSEDLTRNGLFTCLTVPSPSLRYSSLDPSTSLHDQESCSHFHGSPLLTVSLLHSFFTFSSLSATTGGEEGSLIHLAHPLYQSLATSLMFQSDLLGLSTKRCPRNMVGQYSRIPDSLIASRVVRRHCISPCFWSSDCGAVLATRYQRTPRETRGQVRRSAHVANPKNVRYTRRSLSSSILSL